MGLEAAWYADMHTGWQTVEQAGWLVGKHMDRPVERWNVDFADQHTSRHEHVDQLAEHPGGCAGKPLHVGEKITVDGITAGGLRPLSGEVYPRIGLWNSSGGRSRWFRTREIVRSGTGGCQRLMMIWYLEGLCQRDLRTK